MASFFFFISIVINFLANNSINLAHNSLRVWRRYPFGIVMNITHDGGLHMAEVYSIFLKRKVIDSAQPYYTEMCFNVHF